MLLFSCSFAVSCITTINSSELKLSLDELQLRYQNSQTFQQMSLLLMLIGHIRPWLGLWAFLEPVVFLVPIWVLVLELCQKLSPGPQKHGIVLSSLLSSFPVLVSGQRLHLLLTFPVESQTDFHLSGQLLSLFFSGPFPRFWSYVPAIWFHNIFHIPDHLLFVCKLEQFNCPPILLVSFLLSGFSCICRSFLGHQCF